MRTRRNIAAAAVAAALLATPATAASPARVDVGHSLSIAVPAGWRISYRHFTPCSDPIERFSLIRGRTILMLQERLRPARAELARHPRRFSVRGKPTPLECCSIEGRAGWVIQFGDHGRAFYAYLYPDGTDARPLLRLLDSFRAA